MNLELTERTKRILLYGQEEAGKRGKTNLCAEHRLLGLIQDRNVAARILSRLGVSPAEVRSEIERHLQSGEIRSPAEKDFGQPSDNEPEGLLLPEILEHEQIMPLTPSAVEVIRFACEEALALGNKYVGSEHLLVGFVRNESGLAGRILTNLGVTLERLRVEVLALQ